MAVHRVSFLTQVGCWVSGGVAAEVKAEQPIEDDMIEPQTATSHDKPGKAVPPSSKSSADRYCRSSIRKAGSLGS